MRKIIMLNRISIDGYFGSLNQESGGMDWFVPDPEVDIAVRTPVKGETNVPSDTLILGAKTFKMFESFWYPLLSDQNAPKELLQVSKELTRMNKMVFSTNLSHTDWENTEFHKDGLVRRIKELKKSQGGNILIFGSGSIVSQLAKEGLIDRYMFIVSPVIAGKGLSLFNEIPQIKLKLVEVQKFDSSNVLVQYDLE